MTSRHGEMGVLNPATGDLRSSRATPEELAVRWRDTVLIKDGPLKLLDAMTGAVGEVADLAASGHASGPVQDRLAQRRVKGQSFGLRATLEERPDPRREAH